MALAVRELIRIWMQFIYLIYGYKQDKFHSNRQISLELSELQYIKLHSVGCRARGAFIHCVLQHAQNIQFGG